MKAPNAVFSNAKNQSCGSTHLQQNFHMTASVSLYYRFKAPLASRALPEVAVIMVITGATLLLRDFLLIASRMHISEPPSHFTNVSFLTTHSIC